MRDRKHTRARPPRVTALEAVLAGAAVVLVALLALGVHLVSGLTHIDLAGLRTVQDGASSVLTEWMRLVSDVASTDELAFVTTAVAIGLLVCRHWHGAAALVLSVLTTQAAVALIKPLVERDRPPQSDAMIDAGGYSFPSAHSASSVALYGVLALIAAHELHNRGHRRWLAGGAVALCACVGLSRVYLGAHYPTDVLAGWLVGALIALASWRAMLALRHWQPRAAAA